MTARTSCLRLLAIVALSTVLLLVGLPLSPASADEAGDWHIEQVECLGIMPTEFNFAVDGGGHPHIAYLDALNHDLRYVHHDGSTWHFETVDSAGDVGFFSAIAVDTQGHPHIAYMDGTNKALQYAVFDGTSWHFQTLLHAGTTIESIAIALDDADHPHISCVVDQAYLQYAHFDGATWSITTAQAGFLIGYLGTSIDVDSSRLPHIAYYWNGSLRYSRYDGSSWLHQTLASDGMHKSLTVDAEDHPHISYRGPGYTLWYTRFDGVSWLPEQLDYPGGSNSIALDSTGQPRIAYWSRGVKYASLNGDAWTVELVDSAWGASVSLAIDPADFAHMTYGVGGCLYYATTRWPVSLGTVSLMAGQNTASGTVAVTQLGQELEVTYETADGWELLATHLYVGSQPPVKSAPGQFPYMHEHLGGVTQDTYEISLVDLGLGSGDTAYLAAHAELRKLLGYDADGDPIYQLESGWGQGAHFGKGWAMYFPVTLP